MKLTECLLLIVILSGCAARLYPRLDSKHEISEKAKVRFVIETLILPDHQPWRITILQNDKWWHKLDYYSRGQARNAEGSGFSVPEWHRTYLNAQWIQRATSEDIARVLAHEWGHIICTPRCDDEEELASEAGRHILRKGFYENTH